MSSRKSCNLVETFLQATTFIPCWELFYNKADFMQPRFNSNKFNRQS